MSGWVPCCVLFIYHLCHLLLIVMLILMNAMFCVVDWMAGFKLLIISFIWLNGILMLLKAMCYVVNAISASFDCYKCPVHSLMLCPMPYLSCWIAFLSHVDSKQNGYSSRLLNPLAWEDPGSNPGPGTPLEWVGGSCGRGGWPLCRQGSALLSGVNNMFYLQPDFTWMSGQGKHGQSSKDWKNTGKDDPVYLWLFICRYCKAHRYCVKRFESAK